MKTLSNTDDTTRAPDRARGALLFVVLECDRPEASSTRHALAGISEVVIGRAADRRSERRARELRLGVPDGRMSERHARLLEEFDRWIVEDTGSKNGVFVNGDRIARAVLEDGDMIELGHTLFAFRAELVLDGFPPDFDAARAPTLPGLATFVPAMVRAFADLGPIARMRAPILIHGQTGTGKELVARAAHELGGRSGPFVAINCGALPPTLIESELFGVRKGAFSGATEDRAGFIRSADGGTLFLDEIGDLPPASQAALLRVLQEREVTPLGATRPIPVDFFLVAATHHDLEELVRRERFRRDLHARLAGLVITLPPLRERREDFGLIIAALAARHRREGLRFASDAARAMMAHDWPNNVRELETCLAVANARASDGCIRVEHLPDAVRADRAAPEVTLPAERAARHDELVALLREHRGNISAIARATNRSRIQVHRWLKQLSLDPADYR
jgi:transcriptional regulator with AAA-type ATPase domain